MPNFEGKFIFGDWSTSFTTADGSLFIAQPASSGLWNFKELKVAGRKNGRLGEFMLSFGEDQNNELYISTTGSTGPTGNTGKVYKIVPA